ncbi:cytochrome P450 [Gloeophyllum trabeum ATCC 11539]|uniref:Cytochrome P450 n=1 Tax=Gloeophyllum trabeum (strain ATCC 11539 / FP-39264 / Madison 617) TaxID=670483 RepID=S7Q7I9_GLOTA|nr:cytochrome P450 [Gloeophyllum trabeum ATCC 11539]EPQ55433.1 cytochrome P450 [Gloeophyllum trabeum ATCC 11539]
MIASLSLLGVLAILVAIYRKYSKVSLDDVPGPQPESFLLGNMRELLQSGASEADFRWQRQFGGVVKFKGPLGENRLMISDPKALQYLTHSSVYHYTKSNGFRKAIGRILNGMGLVAAEGDVHRRQRKVMLPAFGGPESKALFPVFKSISEDLVSRWQELIDSSEMGSTVVNAPRWLSRATLDAIGEAAFDYKFGALSEEDSELKRAYNNIVLTLFGLPSTPRIVIEAISEWLPTKPLVWLFQKLPFRRFARLREASRASVRTAARLVEEKGQALLEGKGNKDVMSLLVKANASENYKARLTDEELYAEMRIILFAGHETTSNSLTWMLWELAKNPKIQTRLRDEIRATEAAIRARGATEFSLADIESMHYLQAFLKEGLRFHPAANNMFRVAIQDDVVPLSKPLHLKSGKVVGELAIPEGTSIVLSVAAYNRDKGLWGEDADVFNPERWLDGEGKHKKDISVGVVGNLMTFSSGVRSCIGWRFAMTEMQTFLVDLVNNFEIAIAYPEKTVRREGSGLVFPVVTGEEAEGVQLPLRVSVAARE